MKFRTPTILLLLISATASAQTLDFALNTSGPHHVTQGHYFFFLVTGQINSGADEPATPSISGLPYGATAQFVNMVRFCCGTSLYRITPNNPVKISTTTSTPAGTYPLIITYTSQSGVRRSTTYTIYVDSTPSLLVSQAAAVEPPLASLDQWKANRLTYGHKHCTTAELSLWEGFVWYYDGERVYYQIADATSDPSWNTCAQMQESLYRPWVLNSQGQIPSYAVFPHGLAMGYKRTGDPLSRQAVDLLHNAGYASVPDVSYSIGWQLSREVSYGLETHIINEALGGTRSPNFYDLAELLFGHFDQWFVTKNTPYVQPFMVALAAEALINYWDLTHDPRVPPMLQLAADQIWLQSWDATHQCFRYYNDDGSISISQDLNLLIAPLYGWVFQQTGNASYRNMGDQIFNAGVQGAWLDGGKQFSQNYRWSAKYVDWRQTLISLPPTLPPAPLPNTKIAITSPASGSMFKTSSATVNLSGTASDNLGITQVSWIADTGIVGTAIGTTTWSVTGIALHTGANHITVTARDAANNQASASIDVVSTPPPTNAPVTVALPGGTGPAVGATKDKVPPTIRFTSPTSDIIFVVYTDVINISGSASDNVAVNQVTWTTDHGSYGTAAGTTSWTVTGIGLSLGSNRIVVTARDAAGNQSSATLVVYRMK